MCFNITKKKPLKIFEFAVPQIQKSNLDWSDNNQGMTIGIRNIQPNHGDYCVFTWIWFDYLTILYFEINEKKCFRTLWALPWLDYLLLPKTKMMSSLVFAAAIRIKSNSCKYPVVTMIGLDVVVSYCHSLIIIRSI